MMRRDCGSDVQLADGTQLRRSHRLVRAGRGALQAVATDAAGGGMGEGDVHGVLP